MNVLFDSVCTAPSRTRVSPTIAYTLMSARRRLSTVIVATDPRAGGRKSELITPAAGAHPHNSADTNSTMKPGFDMISPASSGQRYGKTADCSNRFSAGTFALRCRLAIEAGSVPRRLSESSRFHSAFESVCSAYMCLVGAHFDATASSRGDWLFLRSQPRPDRSASAAISSLPTSGQRRNATERVISWRILFSRSGSRLAGT